MTGTLHSLEPDSGRAREIAERGLILRTTVGSVVHGLSNPGTDDRDELGVCVEPPEYVLGFRRFGHFVHRTQPEGRPSGPGDLDLTVYGLRRYCHLALKGSPTVLLPLFVEGEHLLHTTPLGERLQALAPAFVSRATGRAFLGYLSAQRRGLTGERHATRTRELSRLHGYDTKYAMHALRIAYQGIELLSFGRITLPVPEPERSELRRVRAGEVSLEDVLGHLEGVTTRLREVVEDSSLPDAPDTGAVDAFLVHAYRTAWEEER
jgi:predicted nucleotidyltransferase